MFSFRKPERTKPEHTFEWYPTGWAERSTDPDEDTWFLFHDRKGWIAFRLTETSWRVPANWQTTQ